MLNHARVLYTLIKHETLTIDDIAKEENLGIVPDEKHLQSLLDELTESDHIHILGSAETRTYTITEKGITRAVFVPLKGLAKNSRKTESVECDTYTVTDGNQLAGSYDGCLRNRSV